MTTLLTAIYIFCFQACAIPAAVRVIRRGSSGDLSLWREGLLIGGASTQLLVMFRTGAAWQVWISPVATLINVALLALIIWWYRQR